MTASTAQSFDGHGHNDQGRPQTACDAVIAHLLDAGALDDAALARARRAAQSGASLPATLVQLGILPEETVARALCDVLGLDLCARDRMPEAPIVEPAQVSQRFLADARAVPVRIDGGHLYAAFADPSDPFPQEALAWATGLEVRPLVGLASDIEAVLAQHQAVASGSGGDQPQDDLALAEVSEDADRLRDLASGAPVIRYVNRLITEASERAASDIHIEPEGQGLRVRQRVDGHLRDVDAPSPGLAAAVLSRIKLLANLDIAERRLPQDGRAKFIVRGRAIDLRIATLPTLDQESVVIRLLDRSQVALDFPALGFSGEAVAQLTDMLNRPNGILLVTGPTGSGKTTTLYTGIKAINDPAKKIITVEDPIEYRLDGVNQVQVKPKIDLTFAKVLRSMLRQDPDVLMVGEIRDLETAEIAVQAALTGHLVLSTLHTNSAADTLTRLRDMGVEPYLLGSTILGVAAQRLVRTLCPECRTPVMRSVPGEAAPVQVFEPVGCPACDGRGYRGRQVIFEIMPMSAELRDAVTQGRPAADVARIAREQGMRTMLETGIAKARAGETSLDEVMRATREV